MTLKDLLDFFSLFTIKTIFFFFYSLWAPMGPPWLWAPGKSSGCPTLSPGLDISSLLKNAVKQNIKCQVVQISIPVLLIV